MAQAKLTSKGQITIPRKVREDLQLESGDILEFLPSEDGYIIRPKTLKPEALKSIIPKPRQPVSIESMNESIRKRRSQ